MNHSPHPLPQSVHLLGTALTRFPQSYHSDAFNISETTPRQYCSLHFIMNLMLALVADTSEPLAAGLELTDIRGWRSDSIAVSVATTPTPGFGKDRLRHYFAPARAVLAYVKYA